MAIQSYGVDPRRFAVQQDISPVMQGLGMLGSTIQQRRQQKQVQAAQQRRQQKRQEMVGILQGGNASEMADFMAMNPDLKDEIVSAQNFRNDATRQKRIDAAMRVKRGEPVQQVVDETAAFIREQGGDPSQTIAFRGMSQEDAQKVADMELAVLLPSDQFKSLQSAAGAVSAEDVQKFDIAREKIEMRKLENQARAMDRALSRETNELKKQELEQKISDRRVKAGQSKKKIDDAERKGYDLAAEASQLAKDIAGDERLSRVAGSPAYLKYTPTTAESQDLINKAQRLESLLTYENLGLMTGVLTDRDIAFLGRLASGLNVSDDGIMGSPKGVKKRLGEISEKIDKSLSKKVRPAEQTQPATPQDSGKTVNWADL